LNFEIESTTMKFLILFCLLAVSSADQDCSAKTDDHYEARIIVDFTDNDSQGGCVRNVLTNNHNIREVEINVGNRDTKKEVNGKNLKDLLKACDHEQIERVTLNFDNVDLKDDDQDLSLENTRELRFNALTEDDSKAVEKFVGHLNVNRNFHILEVFSESEHRPSNILKFLALHGNHIRYFKLTNKDTDIQSSQEKFIYRCKDETRKASQESLENLRKIRQQQDKQRGDRDFIRDVIISAGNDPNDFDFIFNQNQAIKMIRTSLDLSLLNNDGKFENVWGLFLHKIGVNEEKIQKISEKFPNVEIIRICEDNLTDELKQSVKSHFKKADRRQECIDF
jgi:hypothetical protein